LAHELAIGHGSENLLDSQFFPPDSPIHGQVAIERSLQKRPTKRLRLLAYRADTGVGSVEAAELLLQDFYDALLLGEGRQGQLVLSHLGPLNSRPVTGIEQNRKLDEV
jgi:hypothetical protein